MKKEKDKKHDTIDRREALKKLGKHGAYTAPALLTLLFSTKSSAFSPPPPPVSEEDSTWG